VFAITLAYLAVEVAAGFLTNSLALLADAGHMLTDAAGVGLALFAVWLAGRPPDPKRSYGYHRAEILAALANAAILLAASGWLLYEAYERITNPPAVEAGPVVAVAFVGLLVNGGGILLLRAGSAESINVKGAYLEVLSDAVTSVGVIVAAGVMWATGWMLIDPLVSVAIGLFILPRTWGLLKQAAHVLLEGTPEGIDPGAVRAAVSGLPGVAGVHDLHLWSLTAGVNAASLHVVLGTGAALGEVLTAVHECLRHRFPIHHVTVQAEPPDWNEEHDTHD
jgi:cobalt-zinc-cadmium efflux system protein